jgi:Flp pilus assembly protein TadG
MALVLPILLAVAFGTGEYGYSFFVKHSLQAAAREGARRANVSGATSADVNTAINNAMSAAGFDAAEYAITPVDPAVSSGTNITVEVTADWGEIGVEPLPDAMGGLSSSKVVRGKTTMRKE